jgi:hypothetical protein
MKETKPEITLKLTLDKTSFCLENKQIGFFDFFWMQYYEVSQILKSINSSSWMEKYPVTKIRNFYLGVSGYNIVNSNDLLEKLKTYYEKTKQPTPVSHKYIDPNEGKIVKKRIKKDDSDSPAKKSKRGRKKKSIIG